MMTTMILTARQMTTIATVAAGECERQEVGLESLGDLLKAYAYAMECAENNEPITEQFILNIAMVVEPIKNAFGYRQTPVTFASGGDANPWQTIPRAMENLVEYGVPSALDILDGGHPMAASEELILPFLKIHPFGDGNGRTAWILENYLHRRWRDNMKNPLRLSKFKF